MSQVRDFRTPCTKASTRERSLELLGDARAGDRHFRDRIPESSDLGARANYTLLAGPFVALLGIRGAALLNAILLLAAAVTAVKVIGKRVGGDAAGLIALFIFATVSYRSVFLIRPHVFVLAILVWAICLALRIEEPPTVRARRGLTGTSRPLYRWCRVGSVSAFFSE